MLVVVLWIAPTSLGLCARCWQHCPSSPAQVSDVCHIWKCADGGVNEKNFYGFVCVLLAALPLIPHSGEQGSVLYVCQIIRSENMVVYMTPTSVVLYARCWQHCPSSHAQVSDEVQQCLPDM
jgi:hypothetical protein